jgi:hypothetical protein
MSWRAIGTGSPKPNSFILGNYVFAPPTTSQTISGGFRYFCASAWTCGSVKAYNDKSSARQDICSDFLRLA